MKKKKIFFLMRHSGYIRNYDSVIDEFAKRGYEVRLGIAKMNKMYPPQRVEAFVSSIAGVSYCLLPSFVSRWDGAKKLVRRLQDYLRYLDPKYERAVKLKKRAELRVPSPLKRVLNSIMSGDEKKVWWGINMLRRFEKSIPVNEEIKSFLEKEQPDIFLITPLIDFGAAQLEWLKAAKELGIRTALCVASWDNLTNKGLIQIEPDIVIVWNEFQKEEAVKLHRIPEDKVFTTGAQCYDKWFHRKPSTTKEEFCRKVGLEVDKEFILYVGSSPFIAPEEVKFVEKWIEKIRASKNDKISRLGILIRPHPQNEKQWDNVDLSHYGNVTIYPRGGANPVDEESRKDFYDSIFHSKAVVGINTSAMIEAGILNKPVFTILSPEFEETQEGTLHFHYLVKGGLLHISRTFDEHIQQLESVISGDGAYINRIRKFIESFVRPHGLDKPSTPIFVNAVEEIMNTPASPPLKTPFWCYLMRPVLLMFSVLVILIEGNLKKYLGLISKDKKIVTKSSIRRLPKTLRILRPLLLPILNFVIKQRFINEYVIPLILEHRERNKTDYQIIEDIKKISKSKKNILVGPWLSEVGFELLYWIPFLNWAVDKFNIDKKRIIVISRGGAKIWYDGIYEHYIDIFDFYGQEEFKIKNQKRIEITGGQKHNIISEFDREIINKVKNSLRITEFEWLHPSLMYQMFRPYWRRKAPISLIENHTLYRKFDRDVLQNNDIDLPENYIAVKFYFSQCFPDTLENRKAVSKLLKVLSTNMDVVLLSTDIDIDDHSDYDMENSERIHTIKDKITLRNNLEMQTKVIANAKAFFGTYGGFSYLAPFYGVPSVAFYSNEEKFLPVHLDVAFRAFRTLKFGAFDKVLKKDIQLNNNNNEKHKNEKHEFMILNIRNIELLLMGASFSLHRNPLKYQGF